MSNRDDCGKCCERVVISKMGERGFPGPTGPKGMNGANGATGPQGVQGSTGENGTAILAAYNDVAGTGNLLPIGEDVLFTHTIPAGTLSSDGDELEVYAYIEYSDNDSVDLAFKLSATEKYTETIINADPDVRFIKIKIARIDQNNQFWTIESLIDDSVSGNAIQTIATTTTTFDLATISTFEITANNIAIGADQVLLKKAVLYRHNL